MSECASNGRWSLEHLATRAAEGTIETVLVAFPDLYGRLMGKRFAADFFLEQVARDGTHGCNYLLTADMEMEPVPGYRYANWEKGYGDFHLRPDLETLRLASWLDRTALVLCDVEEEASHDRVVQAPRSVLRAQLERAQGTGYEIMAGSELEYYIYRDSYREAARKGRRGGTSRIITCSREHGSRI